MEQAINHIKKKYIHTYIQTYMHTYIHAHIHTYIHTCIHTYTRKNSPNTKLHKYIVVLLTAI